MKQHHVVQIGGSAIKRSSPSLSRRWRRLSTMQKFTFLGLIFVATSGLFLIFPGALSIQVFSDNSSHASSSLPLDEAKLEATIQQLRAENEHLKQLVVEQKQVAQNAQQEALQEHQKQIQLQQSLDNRQQQHQQHQRRGEQVQQDSKQQHHHNARRGGFAPHQPNDKYPQQPQLPVNEPLVHGNLVGQDLPGLPGVRLFRGEESRDFRPKNAQQEAIVKTFKWAWKGYKEFAWGHDELLPVSKRHSEWFHLGLTLIDGLDTMLFMGLKEEFEEARNWVAHDMNMDQNVDVNLFETTIRVLGALLTCYHFTEDSVFLDKARELGDRLMPAFNKQSGVPFSDVNLKTHRAHKPSWGPDSTTSEVTTIQLEFKELSRVTGDPKYANAVTAVMNHVATLPKRDGLVPIFINANTGRFSGNTITFGARGDSYYEYLLKQWLQTGQTETKFKDLFVEAMDGTFRHLLKRSEPNKLAYIAELIGGSPRPKMDHLVCFLPGALGLGAANGLDPKYMQAAKDLAYTCNQMYARMETGLAPEIVFFNTDPAKTEDITVKDADAHNLLRPETVESLFIMYRLTKDPVYRDWGWKIYQNFEKHCRVSTGGYSSLRNVKRSSPGFRDKMESFFLGETLKYLYLLFEDEDGVIPLDKYVFNTEAHPFPIYTP
eukprot:m.268074 g.268074  ORF g.268074 m.268074 type:complete len:658 (+) comp35434_c0_seq1:75-2048(+)